MPIEQNRQRYFWLTANDTTTVTEPEPVTTENSRVTPLIDMLDYRDSLIDAIGETGNSVIPSENGEDFIYIANWWLGLRGGDVALPALANLADGGTVTNQSPFPTNPGPGAPEELIELLKAKAAAGVDVRVIGWISWGVNMLNPIDVLSAAQNRRIVHSLQNNAGVSGIVSLNAETMDAVQHMRGAGLPLGCLLNTLGHTAGAVHIKGAIVGQRPTGAGVIKARAFTGGLDFQTGRWAAYGHEPVGGWTVTQSPTWHDVQAAIEGPAAQSFYDHFKHMWDLIIARPVQTFNVNGLPIENWVTGTPNVPSRTITEPLGPAPFPGTTQHVQSLRTIPTFNYSMINVLPEGTPVPGNEGGVFEVFAAWRKAISGAERYIYIEDQAFWSRDVMEMINTQIRAQPNLRVILIMSGAGDPNDAPSNDSDLLHESINLGLLGQGGATALSAAQINQIRVFQLWGEPVPNDPADDAAVLSVDSANPAFNEIELDFTWSDPWTLNEYIHQFDYLSDGANAWRITGNPPVAVGANMRVRIEKALPPPAVGATLQQRSVSGLTVHSKVMIIDDNWACIGSANMMRRSLFTDWEHSVAFMDVNEQAVAEFRKRIWAEHFNQPDTPAGRVPFNILDEAIGGWDADPAWRTTAAFPTLLPRPAGEGGPSYLNRIALPLPVVAVTADRRTELDRFRDPDSRDAWGGLFTP